MRVRQKNIYLTLLQASKNKKVTAVYPMHALMQDGVSVADVEEFIRKVGIEAAAKMAVTSDNHGRLPIDLIYCFDTKDGKEIHELFLSLLRKQDVKPIAEKLMIDQVVPVFYPVPSQLLENYHVACDIVNKVRSVMHISVSHPDANHYESEQYREFTRNLKVLRKKNAYNLMDAADYGLQAEIAGNGNCAEFSYVAWKMMANDYPSYTGSLVSVGKGDHIFLVMNKKDAFEKSNLFWWNEHNVVVDAWLGEVYSFKEISYRLKTLRQYRSETEILNVLTPINTTYHYLETVTQYQKRKRDKANYGDFYKFFKRSRNLQELDSPEELKLLQEPANKK